MGFSAATSWRRSSRAAHRLRAAQGAVRPDARSGRERMYADLEPDVVIHLAAVVGGIGANRDSPGPLLLRERDAGRARRWSTRGAPASRSSSASAPSAPIRSWRRCRSWNATCGTAIPEETNAPYGIAKKMLLVQGQAYRQQYGFNAIHLLPVNLYGPHDNFDPQSSHVIPALIRKCLEAAEQRRGGSRRAGAPATRRASSCSSRTAPRRSCSRPSATTATNR